jgi:hypothetical protein
VKELKISVDAIGRMYGIDLVETVRIKTVDGRKYSIIGGAQK